MRGLILGLAALVVTSPFAQAGGDSTAGRTVMVKCQSCHGKDGLAIEHWSPNIAGQKQDYLVRSLMVLQGRKPQEPNDVARRQEPER